MAKKKAKPAAKRAAAKKAEKPTPEPKPTPRQASLPGMQDRRVAVLESAALKYADIRDERMQWTKKEVESKKRVKDLMHEQKRTHYAHGNIEIDLVPEDEHVRVRVHDRESAFEPPEEEEVERPPMEEPESAPQPREEPEDPDKVYDSQEEDDLREPHF